MVVLVVLVVVLVQDRAHINLLDSCEARSDAAVRWAAVEEILNSAENHSRRRENASPAPLLPEPARGALVLCRLGLPHLSS